jgi:hypothetical protein
MQLWPTEGYAFELILFPNLHCPFHDNQLPGKRKERLEALVKDIPGRIRKHEQQKTKNPFAERADATWLGAQ